MVSHASECCGSHQGPSETDGKVCLRLLQVDALWHKRLLVSHDSGCCMTPSKAKSDIDSNLCLWLLQVAAHSTLWHKRLLVLTALVPQDLLLAFLAAGAVAVICFAPELAASTPRTALTSYFECLYTALLKEGLSFQAAISAAGKLSGLAFVYFSLDHVTCPRDSENLTAGLA